MKNVDKRNGKDSGTYHQIGLANLRGDFYGWLYLKLILSYHISSLLSFTFFTFPFMVLFTFFSCVSVELSLILCIIMKSWFGFFLLQISWCSINNWRASWWKNAFYAIVIHEVFCLWENFIHIFKSLVKIKWFISQIYILKFGASIILNRAEIIIELISFQKARNINMQERILV